METLREFKHEKQRKLRERFYKNNEHDEADM